MAPKQKAEQQQAVKMRRGQKPPTMSTERACSHTNKVGSTYCTVVFSRGALVNVRDNMDGQKTKTPRVEREKGGVD